MSSEALPLHLFFSESYKEGRRKFLRTCASKNLAVRTYLHPDYKGPDGEDLAIDCTWIGPREAEKVLFITCGTHGLEAAAGSATLLQFLKSNARETMADGLAVLIAHSVNPYGWAFDRRGNEDGIDLNRNCLNHDEPYPDNPTYHELHVLIKNADVDGPGLMAFRNSFHAFARAHGLGAAINGITAGQYDYPYGMSYGGDSLSWSCNTLFQISNCYLQRARKVLLIDWHTGIGDFGKPFFIIDDPTYSTEFRLAADWWPSQTMHADDVLDGGTPDYSGLLMRGLKNEIAAINSAKMVSVVIEWGTYELDAMLQALLMDDWLKDNRMNGDLLTRTVREQLIDRFYPASSAWRHAVLSQAQPIYEQALAGLQAW